MTTNEHSQLATNAYVEALMVERIMKSETPPSEPARTGAKLGTTLQAVLQHSDGGMDSIAVPVPLPDAILRVHPGPPNREELFRRAKSADSVLRYVEDDAFRASAEAAPAWRCARCHGVRSVYCVPKLALHEALTSQTALYCGGCYAP